MPLEQGADWTAVFAIEIDNVPVQDGQINTSSELSSGGVQADGPGRLTTGSYLPSSARVGLIRQPGFYTGNLCKSG